MANLLAGITGMPNTTQQRGGQTTTTKATVPSELNTLLGVFGRNLLGPSVTLPNTPISTPLSQGVSAAQDVMQPLLNLAFGPDASAGLASRLAGQTTTPGVTETGGVAALPGVPQFGRTQTREELGLPDRSSYFPFTPSEEDIRAAGLPPVTPSRETAKGMKKIERLTGREAKLEERIGRRGAAGKPTGAAEKRLEKTRTKLQRNKAAFT